MSLITIATLLTLLFIVFSLPSTYTITSLVIQKISPSIHSQHFSVPFTNVAVLTHAVLFFIVVYTTLYMKSPLGIPSTITETTFAKQQQEESTKKSIEESTKKESTLPKKLPEFEEMTVPSSSVV